MTTELFGCVPGPTNSLMDVSGLGVGHAVCDGGDGDSGVTVIVAPNGAVASVDVRGGGPGTRETDLLSPENTVGAIHAVGLCGGSVFGLDAISGVMSELETQGIGFPVLGEMAPELKIPIVPGAVIFDLLLGEWTSRPTAQTGAEAARRAIAALEGDDSAVEQGSIVEQGNVGAGLGAAAGALKGGFGQASAVFPEGTPLAGYTVSAAVVVNPQGAVFNPDTGMLWGADAELGCEFGYRGGLAQNDAKPLRDFEVSQDNIEKLAGMNVLGTKILPEMIGTAQLNTTIGVVATDAPISKAQAKRLAMASHDGMSRAIRPAHMPMDGDTLFALSTADHSGEQTENSPQSVEPVGMSMLSAAGANCVERAIVHAVLNASAAFDTPTWKEVAGYEQ